jgi:hypothetical protein
MRMLALMKTLILLTSILLLGACATTPTMKSVAGGYRGKMQNTQNLGSTIRMDLLKNGVVRAYMDGKDAGEEGRWKIQGGEVLIDIASSPNATVVTYRIESSGDLTMVSAMLNGVSKEIPKGKDLTFKRIKSTISTKLTATERKVVGIYAGGNGGLDGRHIVFSDNRAADFYLREGERETAGGVPHDVEWKITDGQLQLTEWRKGEVFCIDFYRINPDSSIIRIAYIGRNGKRVAGRAITYKKIK